VDRLEIAWEGEQADLIARRQLKVEQTRGSAFGYRVRAVQDGEQPDLDAFTISVPDDPNLSRGRITAANGTAASFTREVVIVHARRATLALALALLPLAGYAVFARLRKSAFKRDG